MIPDLLKFVPPDFGANFWQDILFLALAANFLFPGTPKTSLQILLLSLAAAIPTPPKAQSNDNKPSKTTRAGQQLVDEDVCRIGHFGFVGCF